MTQQFALWEDAQFDDETNDSEASFRQIVSYRRPNGQFLKWIGNKQRFAESIIRSFPRHIGTYYEPFLGSGAVLGAMGPQRGFGSDCFLPLVEIWQALKADPERVVKWYEDRWNLIGQMGKVEAYNHVRDSYNSNPNGADFVYLTRSCYGGVVRFRKNDGYMSTPSGVHDPISPDSFRKRAVSWSDRVRHCEFRHWDYKEAMAQAQSGDLVYCDPPYSFSQAILYGAQAFSLAELMEAIADCKRRGVFVALSIDGTKKSGNFLCDIEIPSGLFETELSVNIGRSMLKRFQMDGQTLEKEVVSDRLLLTYPMG